MGAMVWGATPGLASLVLAAAAADSAVAASGATVATSVTVPRNTTSSDCRPGHFPGGCLEQVQAHRPEGKKTSRSAAARIGRSIMNRYRTLWCAGKSRIRARFLWWSVVLRGSEAMHYFDTLGPSAESNVPQNGFSDGRICARIRVRQWVLDKGAIYEHEKDFGRSD